ncbi:MAG: hypothetical protein AB7I98_07000, partial [Verrucomicrobiales bacterium]
TEEAVVEVVEVGPFTEIDGQIGFTADYLFPGQPWIQVGPFVEEVTEGRHQTEFAHDTLDSFGANDKSGGEFPTLGKDFIVQYQPRTGEGASSFNVFSGSLPGPYFTPITTGADLQLMIDETLQNVETTEPGLEEELIESGNSPAGGGSAAPADGGQAPASAAGAPLDPFGSPAPPAGAAPALPAEADPFGS